MYTAIIFDFFDVINTDPYKNWLKRYDIERHSGYTELQNNMDNGRIDLEPFFNKLSELSALSIETIIHEYESTKLVDGEIINIIKNLKKSYKIGLLSNAPSEYIRGLLKEHMLEELFDAITISSEAGVIKPSEKAFHHILNKLEAAPHEALFVDDNENNTKAADKLGITSIHFKDTKQLVGELSQLGIKTQV